MKTNSKKSLKTVSAKRKARRKNWTFEEILVTALGKVKTPRQAWTPEKCKKDALKYKSKSAWEKSSKNAYQAAIRSKWMEECASHMIQLSKPAGYWTKENCIEEANKYKTRAVWKKNSPSSYSTSIKNNWLQECCQHMLIGIGNKNTLYNSLQEWKEKDLKSYEAASRRGLLKKICEMLGWEYYKR